MHATQLSHIVAGDLTISRSLAYNTITSTLNAFAWLGILLCDASSSQCEPTFCWHSQKSSGMLRAGISSPVVFRSVDLEASPCQNARISTRCIPPTSLTCPCKRPVTLALTSRRCNQPNLAVSQFCTCCTHTHTVFFQCPHGRLTPGAPSLGENIAHTDPDLIERQMRGGVQRAAAMCFLTSEGASHR